MSSRPKRPLVPALIGVVIMLGLVGATLVTPRSSGGPSTTASTTTTDPTTTTTAVPTTTTVLDPTTLGPEGQELYQLVQTGRAGQYHVRFQLSGTSLPATATSAFLDIWRSGALVRQDTRLEETSGVTHGANIGGPDGTISCQEQPGLAMACQRLSSDPLPPEDDFLSSIMQRLSQAAIEARDDEIAATPVRCFVLDGDDTVNRSELCLTAAGVPLRVDVVGLKADALELQGEVDPAIFEPPAPVSEP